MEHLQRIGNQIRSYARPEHIIPFEGQQMLAQKPIQSEGEKFGKQYTKIQQNLGEIKDKLGSSINNAITMGVPVGDLQQKVSDFQTLSQTLKQNTQKLPSKHNLDVPELKAKELFTLGARLNEKYDTDNPTLKRLRELYSPNPKNLNHNEDLTTRIQNLKAKHKRVEEIKKEEPPIKQSPKDKIPKQSTPHSIASITENIKGIKNTTKDSVVKSTQNFDNMQTINSNVSDMGQTAKTFHENATKLRKMNTLGFPKFGNIGKYAAIAALTGAAVVGTVGVAHALNYGAQKIYNHFSGKREREGGEELPMKNQRIK
jgi:chromosome segregation ATPase